ncbi:MAG: COQ9 family protein [Rhodospirillaceae bacterium]|nr:COQ9 family protein [Rhodospirillaceae bacterium]
MSLTMAPQSPEMEALRGRLLATTLNHVPFDGWSERALRNGAADAGVELEDALRAFPAGIRDVLDYFVADADQRMIEELERRDLASMRIRDRIAVAIRVRLEQNAAHREAIRQAIAQQILPTNGPRSMRSLYRTVDAMWYAAGDTATDFNFYTKRALLAGVYTSTLLYWLDDDSPDFEDSWAFLDRRIENVMGIEKAKARIKRFVSHAPKPLDRNPFRHRRV